MKKKVFMMFALLLAMGGAWAQSTPEPGTLVPTGNTNEWTLTMPADNMLLQVEYYDEYTLDSIPLDWQVLVNGEAATVTPYTEGNTSLGHLTITETDSVELIPPAEVKPNVKSVTLVEPVAAPQLQTVHVGGMADATLYYFPGETWEDAIARPENTGFGKQGTWVTYNDLMIINGGSAFSPNTEVNPNAVYEAIM